MATNASLCPALNVTVTITVLGDWISARFVRQMWSA